MLFSLNICVNKKAPPAHSVHWGLIPTSKTSAASFFAKPLPKSANYPSTPI